MRGVLDAEPLMGALQAYRHLRPTRAARLVPDDDYASLVALVELLCQTWGGTSSLLIPVRAANGTMHEPYPDLLRRSEVDRLVVPPEQSVPGDMWSAFQSMGEQAGLRVGTGLGGHPVLLVAAARSPEQLRAVTSVTVPDHSPWALGYLMTCGRLPVNPNGDLLARGGAQDGLRYSDVLEVRHEAVTAPGLADLKERLSGGCPVGLSRIALSTRRSAASVSALDGWLNEPGVWSRQNAGDVVVLYEPESVADACLLWNLRALHGWPVGLPLGLPYQRKADGTPDFQPTIELLCEVKQHFRMRGLSAHPALVSASLSASELSAIADGATVNGEQPETPPLDDVLAPARPAARSTVTSLTFEQGHALVPTRTDEDREWLGVTGGRTVPLKLTVQVDRRPVPASAVLRGAKASWQYGGGGFITLAGEDTFQEVVWPQTWTMLEAVAHDHGLRVEASANGRHAMALTRMLGDPAELRWLGHRGLLELLYKTAASTSMSWWKRRTDKQARTVADAQRNPEQAFEELKTLITDVNVSHDQETSGTLDVNQVQQALRGERSTAETWLRWADGRKLVQRLVQLKCEHCRNKLLLELGQAVPPLPCPRCGLIMTAPFNLLSLPFRYRLAEPLRRSIDDDSIYHALIMRWLISVFQTRPGHLVGAYPGVNFYRGDQEIGEADIVLLFADGAVVPAEVKRSGRQLNVAEVTKLRKIAEALHSPAIVLGAGDLHTDCPTAITHDTGDGSCRVVTADYWLNPQPRPAFGWRDLPHWDAQPHEVPDVCEQEKTYATLLRSAEQRAFGADDPVRNLW